MQDAQSEPSPTVTPVGDALVQHDGSAGAAAFLSHAVRHDMVVVTDCHSPHLDAIRHLLASGTELPEMLVFLPWEPHHVHRRGVTRDETDDARLLLEEIRQLLPAQTRMPSVLIVGPGQHDSAAMLALHREMCLTSFSGDDRVNTGHVEPRALGNHQARLDRFGVLELLELLEADMPRLDRLVLVDDLPRVSMADLVGKLALPDNVFVLRASEPAPQLDFAALEAIRKPRHDRSKNKAPFFDGNRKGKGKRDRALQKGSFHAPKAHRGGGGRRR